MNNTIKHGVFFLPSAPPTAPDQRFSFVLCLTVLSAQGVSRTTLMCGDTWQARWPLGLSLITLDPNPSGIKPVKPNSHCGSWLASARATQTTAEGKRTVKTCRFKRTKSRPYIDLYTNLLFYKLARILKFLSLKLVNVCMIWWCIYSKPVEYTMWNYIYCNKSPSM